MTGITPQVEINAVFSWLRKHGLTYDEASDDQLSLTLAAIYRLSPRTWGQLLFDSRDEIPEAIRKFTEADD